MEDVKDYHAQHYLRDFISKLNIAEQMQLKTLRLCGMSVNRQYGGVFLVTDGRSSHFHGTTHCRNPWCCPVCTARIMEEYRSKIASAIEMMCRSHFGFMVTFTIPHYGFMSCRETTDILYDTWKYFHQTCYKKKNFHAYTEFDKAHPTADWVRVAEYTWGKKNGWHPHFHCLWWTPRGEHVQHILDWEKRLDEFWRKTAKRITLAKWKKEGLHTDKLREGETLEELVDRLYANSEGQIHGVKFSRDKETGELLEAHDSRYLTGWGADREVTGNIRKEASHSGHYTPYQILNMAEHDPEMEKLYIEFCLDMTRKPAHHRVNFSKNGLYKRIEEWRKTALKKSEVVEKKSTWEVIAFFDEKQWCELCYQDRMIPAISNVLFLATQKREILLEYIKSLGIELRSAPTVKQADDIERILRIYNGVA